jgi:hypothetical protein
LLFSESGSQEWMDMVCEIAELVTPPPLPSLSPLEPVASLSWPGSVPPLIPPEHNHTHCIGDFSRNKILFTEHIGF